MRKTCASNIIERGRFSIETAKSVGRMNRYVEPATRRFSTGQRPVPQSMNDSAFQPGTVRRMISKIEVTDLHDVGQSTASPGFPSTRRAFILNVVAAAICVAPGCVRDDAAVVDAASPVVRTDIRQAVPRESDAETDRNALTLNQNVDPAIDTDAILSNAFSAARRVQSSRMEFHRQERLGLFKLLQPAEHMIALCRESPFSVMFTWLDDDSEFSQCLFIEGENDGAVQLHRRKGLFGGPGGIVAFPPDLAIVFQKAKLPITDFGPRRVMGVLERRIKAAEAHGGVHARYVGSSVVGPAAERCDHIVLSFPDADAHAAKHVELHLDTHTHLPVMVELWISKGGKPKSQLDARYVFARTEANPPLSDDDFVLDADRSDRIVGGSD